MYTRNPYIKTEWQDHIVDIVNDEIIQQGTRFTASRANNIEDALDFLCNSYIPGLESKLIRVQIELEMLGRSPINSGSFYDAFDEMPTRLIRLDGQADIVDALAVGATLIKVSDTSKFETNQTVTVYDGSKYEHVNVTSINTANKTLTVSKLTNAYAKGAKVARSTASVDVVNQTLNVAPYVTYQVDVVEVV